MSSQDEQPKRPEPVWTKSKWKKTDLQGKTIEFRVPAKARGYRIRGNGELMVRHNPKAKDQIEVRISVVYQGRSWAEFVSTQHTILQGGMDRLRPHPDPKVADFLLE